MYFHETNPSHKLYLYIISGLATVGSFKVSCVSDQWKPINPEEKKKYDREFLLGFQFISASMNKPEGLPAISDVVLDKVRMFCFIKSLLSFTSITDWMLLNIYDMLDCVCVC